MNIKIPLCISDGTQDTPPVGITSEHGSLEQRACDNGFCNRFRCFRILGRGYPAGQQLGSSFPVLGDISTYFHTDFHQCLLKGFIILITLTDFRILCQTIRKNTQHVIR